MNDFLMQAAKDSKLPNASKKKKLSLALGS
jgi:hypothetical protein